MTPKNEDDSSGMRDLTARLETALEAMDGALDRARAEFGMERVGRHFLLGPLRVDQWRRYHVLHMRHHRKQIAEVREAQSVTVRHHAAMARV